MFKKIFSNWSVFLALFVAACSWIALPAVHAAELEQDGDLIELAEQSELDNAHDEDLVDIELIEATESTDFIGSAEEIDDSVQVEMPDTETITGASEVQVTMADDKDLIWIGWTFYESSTRAWTVAGGDGGYAFGRYQFDARSSLAPFLKFCIADDEARYGAFSSFVTTKSDTEVRNLANLPTTWKTIYNQSSDEFSLLQTSFAIEYYYLPVKQQLLDLYNINLEAYSAVLRGTVWSIAVRDGRFVNSNHKTNCLRSVTESYTEILATDGVVDEEKWLNRIYDLESERHPSQESRWNKKQRQISLQMLSFIKEAAANEAIIRENYEIMQLSDQMDTGGQPEILFEFLALPNATSESIQIAVADELQSAFNG